MRGILVTSPELGMLRSFSGCCHETTPSCETPIRQSNVEEEKYSKQEDSRNASWEKMGDDLNQDDDGEEGDEFH